MQPGSLPSSATGLGRFRERIFASWAAPKPLSSEIVRSQPYYLIVVITSTVMLLAAAGAHFVANGSLPMGVAVVVAAGFLFLVFADIAIAIAVWVAIPVHQGLHVVSVGPTLVEILIVLAWLGAGGIRRGRLPTLRDHRPLLLAMVSSAAG